MAEEIPRPSTSSRLPDDTVFYSIYPDFSPIIPQNQNPNPNPSLLLHSLHLQILQFLHPLTNSYIFQHPPFSLSPSKSSHHLQGRLRYGDNLNDEWFVVFLLFQISSHFPYLSISIHDSDGQFLLIESAFHLPDWLSPDNSDNRVFIRNRKLHIIPNSLLPNPTLLDSLSLLIDSSKEGETVAGEAVQMAIANRIRGFPGRNLHRVRVRVPVNVARVLREEPGLVAMAVEGFYDRDVDSMRFLAGRMERFLGEEGEFVEMVVTMSRAMYGQLLRQEFVAPRGYGVMPGRSEAGFRGAELGMKIACGFEMGYWVRKREGEEGKGSTWEKFRESLERSGYFKGLMPGSMEYKGLMESAEEYYRKSSVYSKASEIMTAPVKRIDEILALPYLIDDFKGQELPPSDDDSWLYNGEEELNAALLERENEMELYNLKKKQKSKQKQGAGPSSGVDFGLGEIAKSMQAFVNKISSYEGAEVPANSNLKDVDFDAERFLKDIELAMKPPDSEGAVSDVDIEEGSSSDMEFDDSDYESDDMEPLNDNKVENSFMGSYSDAMSEQLKTTTLNKSFVRANQQTADKDEGTSSAAAGDMDEEFSPIDMDVNLVKSFLDSFSSQEGLPGPATNLLGLMGLQLPQDANKDK